jgi:selenocysteine lyase/cysteine desulfurase
MGRGRAAPPPAVASPARGAPELEGGARAGGKSLPEAPPRRRPRRGKDLDAQEFRRQFPALGEVAHLASCSQGALSQRVIEADAAFLASWRRRGAPWDEWMAAVERVRRRFAGLVGAGEDEVAVVSCASEGAHQVASSLPLQDGRRTWVVTDLEFPSVAHVWRAQAEARGLRLRLVPAPGGSVDPDRLLAAVTPDVALVSVPLVAYANGLRLPVAEVVARAHAVGARVFVDAYQGVGVLPVDVRRLGCDYLVAGALKYLLGAPGIAFLYVRREIVPDHRPSHTGWFGRRDPFAFDPNMLDYAPDARRFEIGTPAIPAAYAADAGLSLVGELDLAALWPRLERLAQDLQERLLALGARLASPLDPARRGPQVTVRTDHPQELAAFLAERGVIASPRGRAVRFALHHHTDAADVERAAAGVAAFAAHTALEEGPG